MAWRALLMGLVLGLGISGPASARFMQPDPIGYAGGMNLYAYAQNDPINFVDPWGLRWRPACSGVPDPLTGALPCGWYWVPDEEDNNFCPRNAYCLDLDEYRFRFPEQAAIADAVGGDGGLGGNGGGPDFLPDGVTLHHSCEPIPSAHSPRVQNAALNSLGSGMDLSGRATGEAMFFIVGVGDEILTTSIFGQNSGSTRTVPESILNPQWQRLRQLGYTPVGMGHGHVNNTPPSLVDDADAQHADKAAQLLGSPYYSMAIDKSGLMSCIQGVGF